MHTPSSLAYVFWHWKQDEVAAAEYEDLLHTYHRSLAARPPAGYAGSTAYSREGIPWVADGRASYEDWYRIDDSGGLDRLNDMAVSPPHLEIHDRLVRRVAGVTAGLYALRIGGIPDGGCFAHWFSKPHGVPYHALFDTVSTKMRGSGALWVRRMVLGPTPEFCLHHPDRIELPRDFTPTIVELKAVFPRPAADRATR